MTRRTVSLQSIWPALLGVLAAHQIAYSGHDDGHVHGYLETVGPALVVAAILGWIWSWARARVEFRSVLTLQLVLFGSMEIGERLAATTGLLVADVAPIAIALVLIPLASGLTVLTDRATELFPIGPSHPVPLDVARRASRTAIAVPPPVRLPVWSIRAPPALV